jgi:hypothetical protein
MTNDRSAINPDRIKSMLSLYDFPHVARGDRGVNEGLHL